MLPDEKEELTSFPIIPLGKFFLPQEYDEDGNYKTVGEELLAKIEQDPIALMPIEALEVSDDPGSYVPASRHFGIVARGMHQLGISFVKVKVVGMTEQDKKMLELKKTKKAALPPIQSTIGPSINPFLGVTTPPTAPADQMQAWMDLLNAPAGPPPQNVFGPGQWNVPPTAVVEPADMDDFFDEDPAN